MGKRKRNVQQARQGQELTHEEIWDDSALINSWNDALEEYKMYHSIHARGENIEDVIREAEMKEEMQANGHADEGDQIAGAGREDDGEEEEGEIGDDQAEVTTTRGAETLSSTANGMSAEPTKTQSVADAIPQASGIASVPQHLLGGVQDDALKNLMMSWYYAGYYTGLYEGQQRAQQASLEQQKNGSSGS